MKRERIAAIVEGHGEQHAVPALIKNWLTKHNLHDKYFTEDTAIRASGCGALKCPHDSGDDLGIEHYVPYARAAGAKRVLIVIDADRECIQREQTGSEALGLELKRRAEHIATDFRMSVVVGNRTAESWFLASLVELRAAGQVAAGFHLSASFDIEAAPGHKTRMARLVGEKYEESVHMKRLASKMRFEASSVARSRSLRKLVKELAYLTDCP